jgi:mannose-1-phosphate guanylyltransferase
VALKAYELCMPRLYALFTEQGTSVGEKYARMHRDDAISIDFGVMEDLQKKGVPIAVLPVDYGWSDLGSFTALEEIDKAVYGTVVSHNSASNIVQCDSGMVALMGVNDLVVIKDGDVVLVTTKDRCQELRSLVDRVRKEHPKFS